MKTASTIRKRLLFALFLIPIFSDGQPLAKSLLWRISGRGLTAPSYLYGTMHLTDERLFRLGDSVYQAINQSAGFAAELDPRQITLLVVGKVKEQALSSEKVSDILSKKDFEKYGDQLAERLHKNKKDITSRDISNEKNKWLHEKLQSGKMETFLDAYLMDIARREGKWLGGVEMMEDQAGLINDLVGKSDIMEILADRRENKKEKANDELEKMISVYDSQDLDGIAAMSEGQDSTEMDALLVKRNRKMAASMDSLSHIRTMMFAVGAAHLPGEKGLIRLLRQTGFTVDPVFSSHRVAPAEAHIVEKPESWTEISDNDSSYSVSMPGQAEDLDLYGFQSMKVDVDIFKYTTYLTSSFVSPGNDDKMDSVTDELANRIFSKTGHRTVSPVNITGVAGKKYLVKDADGLKQGYVLRKGKRLFLAFGYCAHPDSSNNRDIEKFLASFRVRDPLPSADKSAAYHFVDSLLGYAMDLPAEPKKLTELLAARKTEGVSAAMYLSTDNSTGLYYLMGSNTLDRGRYIENDSSFLRTITEKVRGQFSIAALDTTYIEDGFRVAEMDGSLIKSPGYHLHTKIYLLNNRWYLQSIMYSGKSPDDALQRYFHSFRYIAIPKAVWSRRMSSDSLFSVYSPSNIISVSRYLGTSTTNGYNSADTGLAVSYDIGRSKFPDYYWAESDSAMWTNAVTRTVAGDSLYYRKNIRNGETEGIEIMKAPRGTSQMARYRMFMQDREMFIVMSVQQKEDISSENNNRFFESFRFNTPKKNDSITSPRISYLMSALKSADSAKARKAREFLKLAPLKATDVDTLLRTMALLKNQDWKDEQLSSALYDAVIRINDNKTYDIARHLCQTLPDSASFARVHLLRIMARRKDSAAYAEVLSLLKTTPPAVAEPVLLLSAMSDSLELLLKLSPTLLPMTRRVEIQPMVLPLINKLIDSNRLTAGSLTPYASDIIRGSSSDTAENEYSRRSNYAKTLNYLNSEAGDRELRRYLEGPADFSGWRALSGLLNRNKPVGPDFIDRYATDLFYRAFLFDLLQENKKAALFPVRFKSEKSLATSRAWEESEEDYGDTITFVSQAAKMIGGKPFHLYIFRLGNTGEPGGYLAAYGPYPDAATTGKQKPHPLHLEISGDEYNAEQKTAQIKYLVTQFGKEEK